MKQGIFTVTSNAALTPLGYKMVLEGDSSAITGPGQFVDLRLPEKYLRRPISVCDYTDTTLTLIYKVVGEGTEIMSKLSEGTKLDVLSGLGNGFDISKGGKHPVLAGGGIGIAPLYGLAQRMLEAGMEPTIALGFRTAKDVYYLDEFVKLGCRLLIATEDGSMGTKGFVTDCIKAVPECDYVFTCGPLPMLKAVHSLPQLKDGQFSFEARMGCGFGACMGCTIPTTDGYKRVCKDGPILYKEEIEW